MITSQRIGILLALGYCLINIFSTLLVSMSSPSLSPFKLIFYNVLIFMGFLSFKNLLNPIKSSTHIFSHTKDLLKLNLSSAISWITAIYSLTLIHPIIFISLMFGLLPAFSLILSPKEHSKSDKHSAFLLMVISWIIAIIYLFNCWCGSNCVFGSNCFRNMSIGALLVIISSLCTAFNFTILKKLTENGLSDHKVLLSRYLLLLIVCLVMTGNTDGGLTLSKSELIEVILISFSYTIIPVLLLQAAIHYSSTTTIAFIIPLQPAIIVILQANEFAKHFSLLLTLALLWLSCTIIFYVARKVKEEFIFH